MKHMKKMPETSTSPMDDALSPAPGSAPAPVSAPTPASAPAFHICKKDVCFYCENNAAHYCKVSSEIDRENAVCRLKEGFSNSYVVDSAKCYFQSLQL